MPDRQVPRQVAPEIELLPGVARLFRELGQQLLDDLVDLGVQLRARDDVVDQAPGEGFSRRNGFVQQQDFPRPAFADDQGQELGRTGQRHAAVAGADVPDVDVVGGDGEITAQVELVPAPDDDPVEPRHRRLPQVAQALVDFDELPHPLPVVARSFEELLLLLQVRPDTEGALAGAGQDQHPDGVIPAGIF
jgi:hypothetical protein